MVSDGLVTSVTNELGSPEQVGEPPTLMVATTSFAGRGWGRGKDKRLPPRLTARFGVNLDCGAAQFFHNFGKINRIKPLPAHRHSHQIGNL